MAAKTHDVTSGTVEQAPNSPAWSGLLIGTEVFVGAGGKARIEATARLKLTDTREAVIAAMASSAGNRRGFIIW